MTKRFSFLCLFFALASLQLSAQYDMNAPVPADPLIRTGKLSNGLTYYVRHNAEPKERANFYIIQNVGAILENDDQDGLAHFLEHMAFNGSKHFPGRKTLIKILEKYGIEFGGDINAYTSQDETVYNIDNVPTTNPKLLDTCLLILHDWSHFLTLKEEEIDAERPVISEEWRTRRNSQFRMRAQLMPVLLNNSKYAHRDVIGNLELINNFPYQALRDFYAKWYRPDLQAIVVVGDFDADEMEKKVITLFSGIPAPVNPTPRPSHEVAPHDDIKFALVTDKELTRSTVAVYIKFPATPNEKKNHEYARQNLIRSFYNSMFSQRINELLQKGNPPFINASSGFSGLLRGVDVYAISAGAKPNEEALALEAIYRENERVKRFGFTEGELQRVKTNTLVSIESSYKQRDKTTSSSYVNQIMSHFLSNEPLDDTEYSYHFYKTIIPTVTLEEVSALAKQYINHQNMVIVVQGPTEGATHLAEQEALAIINKVEQATDIEPYQDKVPEGALVNEELTGSSIVSVKKLPRFDAEEWALANGAKVFYRKADFEKDEVALTSYSKGGTSLYDLDKLASASVASQFVSAYGVGDYDLRTLQKLLTGKQARVGISIAGLTEAINGTSTPADFETLLQLIYLYFEKPRFDREVHQTLMERNYAAIVNQENNPRKIMQDSVSRIMSNYHPRVLLTGKGLLDAISLDQIEEIYRDRMKDASDFTFFIVGNIDAETVKPLVEKYIGSISSYKRAEKWKDHRVGPPKGKTTKVIPLTLETPKTTVITRFSKDMKYTIARDLYLSIIKGILDIRYTENVREKEGGTYGVQVGASAVDEPSPRFDMTMSFDCDPERANDLKPLIYTEVEKMMKEGPTAEELEKVVTNMLKNHEQSKPHNNYWMSVLRSYYLDGINADDPKYFEDILKKVRPKDIQKFAKSMFEKADVVDITFVPR
ncbi:MAG: insulinase family protein [Odoribacteraceae bacterium]|jgi:zinc protease|nr:insulinase family protein [Odoribacteraceae bacterium]